MDLRRARKKTKAQKAVHTASFIAPAAPDTAAPPAAAAPTGAPPAAAAPAAVPAVSGRDDGLAASERAEIVEALLKAAVARGERAEAREKAVAALTQIVEARERAAADRESLASARDKAATERDSIANARDRVATERDSIANTRPAVGHGRSADAPDTGSSGVELEQARLEAELQRAHLDGLTGALRREMGRLTLRNEIDRARRGDGKFVMAFIDVDGLKEVNDRDGHAAGDRVLRTLVATMRANLRSYDPIVRFGGDEFICGITSTDPTEVQHRIGVIDQSLRSATGVGITAGLASLGSNESLDELTARADAALIEAKHNRS
jgi:diguanylate cyclase (GGDEF)-like protein